MGKFDLRSRLFLSHLAVALVAVASLTIIGKISSPRFFVLHLQKMERRGVSVRYIRTQLVDGFELAWSRSTLWSVAFGAVAAAGVSYWVSQRITHPLTQMKTVTQKFSQGNLSERVPPSEIPEIEQLSASFNRMAASIEGIEQRRRQLIGDLTHELRTPMTVLRGYLEEMSSGQIEPSVEIYQRLAREAARLERLVNDLQELSKAEAGYLPIDAQPVDVQTLLRSLVDKFSDQLLDEGPTLTLEAPNDLPKVLADPDRLEQILVNLLGNAMHHTASGSIIVRAWVAQGAKSPDSHLWIAVRDTGEGIAPEQLPHIFERFWRSGQAQAKYPAGTGIGLAISKRLIELQGGQIEVESQLSEGSTFRFCLPLA